jgi:hypothetical protein
MFLDISEPVLFGYHKNLKDENYYGYLRKTDNLQYENVLYGVQIRSAPKSKVMRYFDYCDQNYIESFDCNTDLIMIKEKDLDKMCRFISKEYGELKINGRYNKGVTVSQGMFCLICDEKNKTRNMEK